MTRISKKSDGIGGGYSAQSAARTKNAPPPRSSPPPAVTKYARHRAVGASPSRARPSGYRYRGPRKIGASRRGMRRVTGTRPARSRLGPKITGQKKTFARLPAAGLLPRDPLRSYTDGRGTSRRGVLHENSPKLHAGTSAHSMCVSCLEKERGEIRFFSEAAAACINVNGKSIFLL